MKTMQKFNQDSSLVSFWVHCRIESSSNLIFTNSVLENVENGKICDFVATKITLLHNYARNTLHKCSAGYELDGNEKELIRLKKGIESLKTFLFKKLQCSITSL